MKPRTDGARHKDLFQPVSLHERAGLIKEESPSGLVSAEYFIIKPQSLGV